MKVAWLPDNLNENKSFLFFKKAFSLAGFNNISNLEFYSNLQKTDFLVLNFYEDINKKAGVYFISFLGKIFRFFRFKFCGIKILFVLNNKIPHDNSSFWSKKMMKFLVNNSYKIICLCHDSEKVLKTLQKNESKWNKKLIFLPHPNYIENENQNNYFPSKFSVLFFGAIRPYKNVDILIKSFNEFSKNKDCSLIIAGRVKDLSYKNYIENLAKENPKIELKLEFIPDEEIVTLIQKSSICVFPYDNETSLNSGSVLLSSSYKRSFICPNIGTVNDFKNKNLFYSYDYNTNQEHFEKLIQMLETAYSDFQKNPLILKEKGENLFEYVKNEHSVQKLAEILNRELR